VQSADDVAETPAPLVTATDARRAAELRAQLQHESAQHVNNLWPWLTLGVGAGAVLVGALGGAGYVLACDGECGTTPWVSVLVVAGAGVAVLGTIWLLRINADNAQVESRTRRLERELDRLDHAAGLRNRVLARGAPIVSLHF
jgi:anti-sigma-K factor RskA